MDQCDAATRAAPECATIPTAAESEKKYPFIACNRRRPDGVSA
jgi:hypothetical protein